jgi:L-threonylcarbamoyladenylate synthase
MKLEEIPWFPPGTTMMKTELLKADHPVALYHAADILKHGGLVVFPTDTVYGLAALPFQAEYVERLYIVKGRNSARAIALLVPEPGDLARVSNAPSSTAMRLAERFWPGPLTLIVARDPSLPEVLSPLPTIGVRIPDHPVALELLRITGPLAVTSANLSGQENTTTAQEALSQLKGRVDLIIDGGRTPGGIPSTVVDCTGPETVILREGPITEREIQNALAA